ncbi:hypothetical protein P2H44_04475 [Albimonas sp. CAU 1670]|uniref:SMP-30/gluconolactonase/LRE family protein n=1 Tax=Albimonas sp. CAU 1670 TaxID=3032599 RepID=UPI0023DA754E|nr:hypothetical protein [Albimonas sp. CAU 1670]MDF2231800.1 hypothetical protein [Albimonas sp. CAU 1670]
MSFARRLKRDVDQILFPNRDRHAIPSMDGAMSPNDRLDRAHPVGDPLPGADGLCPAPESFGGGVLVSAGRQVLRLSGPGYETRELFAELDGPVGALALHPDGRVLACVQGVGLMALAPDGGRATLAEAEGAPLPNLTDVAAAPDGSILLAQGSRDHAPDDFIQDLMALGRSGLIARAAADLGSARVLAGGLQYPAGVAVQGDLVRFTEAWTHRLLTLPLAGGATKTVVPNMPGYPGRLSKASSGGWWLTLFAMRTHLTELVLREDDFRAKMTATIPPEHWIGPALRTTGSYYEPLQAGNVKKLGVVKPWAPPRSYGLAIRIDDAGEPLESLHSRVGGQWHGITATLERPEGLLLVSKGQGQVLLAGKEAA